LVPVWLRTAATIGAEMRSPYDTIASSVRAVHSRRIATPLEKRGGAFGEVGDLLQNVRRFEAERIPR